MIIRPWKAEDAERLVQLTFQWGFETTIEEMNAQLRRIGELNNAEVFVAEAKGKVLGRIFVMEHLTVGSSPFSEVHSLVVDINFRKQGIGKALIEAAKEWSKAKGFAKMRLRTNAKREEANIFYPKIGFDLEKVQNVYQIDL